MKNNWLKNHRAIKWRVQITGTDTSGRLCIFDAPFKKFLDWESEADMTVECIEVVDGNDFPVWSQHVAFLQSIKVGDILRLAFPFDKPVS